VLVRPDGHVAWRNGCRGGRYPSVVVGKKPFLGWVVEQEKHGRFNPIVESVANGPEDDPKNLAAFQKEVN